MSFSVLIYYLNYSNEATIPIYSGFVSREHCEIACDGTGWHIKDLNTLNGTYINNTRLEPNIYFPLNVGDKIGLGISALVFNNPAVRQNPEYYVYRFNYFYPFLPSAIDSLTADMSIQSI
jgi:pSer/pThr/pTyr-binding forkhead associated (FHA) protein